MGGKLYKNDIRLTEAYCEGRRAQIAAYPGAATNPFVSGSPQFTAFADGVTSYNGANPTNYSPQDYCAERGTT